MSPCLFSLFVLPVCSPCLFSHVWQDCRVVLFKALAKLLLRVGGAEYVTLSDYVLQWLTPRDTLSASATKMAAAAGTSTKLLRVLLLLLLLWCCCCCGRCLPWL